MENMIVDSEILMANINSGVEAFIDCILQDGIISQEQADQIEMYKIVVIKKNIFGRIVDNLFNKKDNGYKIIVVKLVNDTGKVNE